MKGQCWHCNTAAWAISGAVGQLFGRGVSGFFDQYASTVLLLVSRYGGHWPAPLARIPPDPPESPSRTNVPRLLTSEGLPPDTAAKQSLRIAEEGQSRTDEMEMTESQFPVRGPSAVACLWSSGLCVGNRAARPYKLWERGPAALKEQAINAVTIIHAEGFSNGIWTKTKLCWRESCCGKCKMEGIRTAWYDKS